MAKIIKEEFTGAEKQDIIADESDRERTNLNESRTRIIQNQAAIRPPSGGGSNSGY
jgi:hypothetical protein